MASFERWSLGLQGNQRHPLRAPGILFNQFSEQCRRFSLLLGLNSGEGFPGMGSGFDVNLG